MKNTKLLILSLGWFLTQTSFGNVFTYTIKGLPKENTSCYSQSKAVASHFENKTQVKVTHIECIKENNSSYDFSIEYEAPTELKFTTTDYKWLSVYKKGRYAELKTCNQHLSKQVEIFEKTTHLSAIFGYCRDEEYSFKPWAIVITALGTAELEPRLGGYLFFTAPKNITYSDLFNGLKQSLESKGAVLSDLVFQGSSLMSEATIHYYSKDKIDFSLERFSRTQKLEICQSQLEEAKSWFKSTAEAPFTIYCGGPDFGNYELNFGFAGRASVTAKNSAESFNNYEDCEKNKAEVISHYEGSSTKVLLGGFCSLNDEGHKFSVSIVSVPKH